ncbi:MAG TPA: hypothetical protein V6D17_19150 [Candidatus Obscuribacterales bacterium]
MNRFWTSFGWALIITIAIMGPAYGFGVLYTIATGGDAVAYFVDCIKLAFVVLGLATWGVYELEGWREKANRPRSEDPDQHGPTESRTEPKPCGTPSDDGRARNCKCGGNKADCRCGGKGQTGGKCGGCHDKK